jgi:ABC-2 type transport system permease protein
MQKIIYKYWLVFKLAAAGIFEYRFDFVASTFKYSFMVLMIALVWVAISRENPDLPLTTEETIRYYFFSAIIYNFSNFHTSYIEEDIKLGTLTKFLLKPISAYTNYIVFELAKTVISTTLKLVTMIPVLWMMGLGFGVSLPHLVLATIFMPFVYVFSYSFFTLISGLTFWITEAHAIRWSLTIAIRFLSGIMIPINFLSPTVQQIFYWLPFQHLAYTPILLIQAKLSISQGLQSLAILATWLIIFNLVRYWQWQAGYKQYEGTGI